MSLKSSEKTGTNEVTISLEIDAATFADAVNKAYNKAKGKIEVPGFRKGKAPKAFIEKMYGEGVFYDDALEIAFPEVYEAAIKEAELDVVDNPFDFDIKTIGKDGVDLTCKVTVKPEIEIGEYKGIKAEKATVTVTAEDVDAEIKKKQEANARMVDVDDRAVESGDIATINYEGFNDGVAFDGGKAEDYDLEIGGGQFIPGFEDQIIGHSVGEEFDINVTFPEEYGAEELAGKPVVFKIKINGIKKKEYPELDDDFVKDISEFDTIDELKADTEKTLKEAKENEADSEFRSKILDLLTDTVTGEIPDCMIEKAIDDMINDMDYRLRMQGMDFKTYMQYMGMDEAKVRETYKDQAEKQVKLSLAIEKIAGLENIEATEEDIEKEYQKFADMYKMEIEKIKEAVSVETIKNDLTSQKTVDFIIENAKATKPRKPAAKKTVAKKSAKTEDESEEKTEEKTSEESAE